VEGSCANTALSGATITEDQVRKLARRLAIFGMSMVSALATVTAIGSPAQAYTNPFRAASACTSEFGGEWTALTDNHREIDDDSGTAVGDVYVMRNSATRFDCAVTLLRDAGVEHWLSVMLGIQGASGTDYPHKSGYSEYYVAVQGYVGYKCVAYWGSVDSSSASRAKWASCL